MSRINLTVRRVYDVPQDLCDAYYKKLEDIEEWLEQEIVKRTDVRVYVNRSVRSIDNMRSPVDKKTHEDIQQLR